MKNKDYALDKILKLKNDLQQALEEDMNPSIVNDLDDKLFDLFLFIKHNL
jgi:hypothetical protein